MNYTTSKDYEKLWSLVQEGKEIVCFVNYRYYDYKDDKGKIERDICLAKFKNNITFLFSREAIYYSTENTKEFLYECRSLNLEFLPPTTWIKIESDKDLPPIGEVVLFRLAGNKYTFSGYWNGTIWMCICSCYHWSPRHTTHWKPMPEAPEVGE